MYKCLFGYNYEFSVYTFLLLDLNGFQHAVLVSPSIKTFSINGGVSKKKLLKYWQGP